MFKLYKKKVINSLKFFPWFFENYLPHIVFLVFTFQVLLLIGALPYFNILRNYYYFAFGILWILANILFKKYITNRKILILGIMMFVIAIPAVLINLESAADSIGFVAFLLLLTYVLRQLFIERRDLQKYSINSRHEAN